MCLAFQLTFDTRSNFVFLEGRSHFLKDSCEGFRPDEKKKCEMKSLTTFSQRVHATVMQLDTNYR